MNCKKCDYPLWNLRARVCPECGEPFLPSQYRFAINSVRFCCPHCLQDYYGTGETGHLVPPCFECVKCRQRIDMDEMILLPTEGVTERQTRPDVNPWLDAERGLLARWLATVGRGMVNPVWLLRSTPLETGAAQGWGFALLTHAIFTAAFLLPLLLFFVVLTFAGAAGGGGPFGFMRAWFGLLSAVPAVGSLIFLVLWVATAHALLRLGGRTAGGIGRTVLALCFTCGPQFVMLVPCLNFYFGWLGTLWWVIVAGFALAAAQKVSGVRAAIAVSALPLLCGMILAGLIVLPIVLAFRAGATGGWTAYAAAESVSPFRAPIQTLAAQGPAPRHGAELISRGNVFAAQFVSPYSNTTPALATIAGFTLEQADGLSPELKVSLAQRAVDSLPPSTIAHRVGDFVFALDALGAGDPGLWVVIESWHPRWNAGVAHTGYALTAGRSVVTIPPGSMGPMLNAQNAQRAQRGLPPLPDPATVLESGPASPGG